MKVLGLITEYNPFHNGHLYHLKESKKISGADYVVCVMSGNFIQRGEPALVNKWARTKAALLSGIDLVIELPTVYAMSSAEFFAFGAVKILDSLGIINFICFGSESGKIGELNPLAEILYNEPEAYKTLLRQELATGVSYPSARSAALNSYMSFSKNFSGDLEQLVNSSNNILGVEYLKALKRLNSSISPLTIKRVNNSYNSENISGSISSATAIRNYISGKTIDNVIENTVPQTCLSILKEEFLNGRGPVFSHNYTGIIFSIIRRMNKEQLAALPYVSEGLENRIKEAAEISGSLDELVNNVSTKRYPKTRIQRTLLNLLTGITRPDFDSFTEHGGPQYVRVLGFNKNGRHLLSHINKKCSLPVILKTADFKNSCNPLLVKMLQLESNSTDIYVLGYANPEFRKGGQEFTQNVVRV